MLTNLAMEVKDMIATASGIGITHLGQIAINTKDVDRAAAFYQDKLGSEAAVQGAAGAGVF